MIATIIAALMTAASAGWLVYPLLLKKDRAARRVIAVFALGTLGLYLLLGSPDLPGLPALFEKSGPRAAARAQTREELDLMKTVAANPTDIDSLLSLAALRLKTGRAEDAQTLLEYARDLAPGRRDIKKMLEEARKARGGKD